MSKKTSVIEAGLGASPSPYRKRRDIQGLRAIAVILVVIEHTSWGLAGGFTGVDIFFVISGFVITCSLLRDLNGSDRVSLREFYKRRIFRLMPAATLVILVAALVSVLLVSPLGIQQQTAATGGAALVWASNLVLYVIASDYFSPHHQANPFLHTWSLGVEEQFYVVFPVVIGLGWLAARKLRINPVKFLLALILLIGAASFALSLATSMGDTLGVIRHPVQFAFYMMPTRAWEFAVGVLLALAVTRHPVSARASAAMATTTSALGLLLIGVGSVVISSAMYFPGYAALLPVFGATLVILGGSRSNSNTVASSLGAKPIVWVGDRSYSLYLWHWPLIVFARRIWPDSELAIVMAVLAALILADRTYRYVEEPVNALGRQPLRWRSIAVPMVSFVAAGVACVALLMGSLVSWNDPQLRAVTDQLNERPLGHTDCLSTVPVSQRDTLACTWGADRPGAPIYLMGDSNAQQYTEALIGAAEQLNRPLIVATWGGCPFVDVEIHNTENPTKGLECSVYVQDGTEWIGNQPPGTVVLANSGGAISSAKINLAGQSEINAKARVWQNSLHDQLERLKQDGHEALLIAKTPHFPDASRDWWHPADCSYRELVQFPERCSASLSAEEMAEQRSHAMRAEHAAAEATRTPFLDPAVALCADDCSTYRDGIWVYRDGLHISPRQSRDMANLFVAALA